MCVCMHPSMGLSGGTLVKNLLASAGDGCLIPELGRSPEVEKGNPLQYSCLESSMDWGACQPIAHGVAKTDMTEWLSMHANTYKHTYTLICEMNNWFGDDGNEHT